MKNRKRNIQVFVGALTYKHYLGIILGAFLTLTGGVLQFYESKATENNQDNRKAEPSFAETIKERGEINIKGIIYRGALTDNLSGFGEIIWPDLISYRGEIKKGFPDGEGEMHYPGGKTYRGRLEQGKIQGFGEMQWSDGRSYRGEFRDGIISGKGDFIDANGERFTGDFRDEEPHGKGTLFSRDSSIYMGQMQNGLKQGRGTLAFSDGGLYEGSFVKNLSLIHI